MIYFDHNATTPIDPRVLTAMSNCAAECWANPASQHRLGQQARRRLRSATDLIAHSLGADPRDQVILTSGGTESNNLAIRGLIGPAPGTILVSSIEHPSVLQVAHFLATQGYTVLPLAVDRSGQVCLDRLEAHLTPAVRLISVMLANNETGVIQPVGEIAERARKHGIPVHTDAVQMVGKLPVDFRQLGVVALSATAHKLHGPVGIGVLLVRQNMPVRPLFQGGTQQMGLRPGTESVALAVGFAHALELALAEQETRRHQLSRLRDLLELQVLRKFPTAEVIGAGAPRTPHTSCMSFPGLDRQQFFLRLDQAGLACSTGSACASGSSEPSPVLQAMGCLPAVVAGALRFSLGIGTSESEVLEGAKLICRVAARLGGLTHG